MNSITSEIVIQKFETLPKQAQKEVADFIDFLLQKKTYRKKKLDKQKLLDISQWSDDDIKAIDDAGKDLNKWQMETF